MDPRADINGKLSFVLKNGKFIVYTYTCRGAYELEDKILPQAIEIADSDLYEDSKKNLIVLNATNENKVRMIKEYFKNNFFKSHGHIAHRIKVANEIFMC